MADDQSDVLRFLSDPATHGGLVPEHIETHGAHVFLAGDEALKIKRAVRYDYMDFSTLPLREEMLKRELALNRPSAPGIYREVVPITRGASGFAIDGTGEPVEWVLRMKRFPKENELLHVAERGELDDRMAEELGRTVAAYHAQAPVRDADGAQLIRAILDELDDAFAGMTTELGADRTAAFHNLSRQSFDRISLLLSVRSRSGHVRRCHGDLHLRNLVLLDGRPVPFDALEFDEKLGTCDVLYDLAFLIMDLRHRDLGRAANLVLNTWLFDCGGTEDEGLRALPLFLAIRAAIRAMVDVQVDAATHHEGQSSSDARAYLDEALSFLAPPPPRLIAVGGLSGSGKTTQGRLLAPRIGAAPGAIHLRSDLERKRLAGVGPLEHLPDDAYTAEAGKAVYSRIMTRAETILAAGHSVILDATWLAPDERAAAEHLAARAGVPFAGLWLEAPASVLGTRVTARKGDASDADAQVVAKQLERDTGAMTWTRIDTSGTSDDVAQTIRTALGV
jgi:uncharacterized protein